MRMDYRPYRECDFRDSTVIVGFPSLGLVSSIATNFLSREQEHELVGGFTSPDFPPYCILQNGSPMPQVRVFSSTREIDPEKPGMDCEKLYIVTSEFIPKPEQSHGIAMGLLDWIMDSGIKTIIVLDGMPMFTPGEYKVLAAGSSERARSIIEDTGLEMFNDGMVRGVSGILLYECSVNGVDAISIMGTAKSELPDPIGGAHLVETLGLFFPEMELDVKPLYEEAEELDKRIGTKSPLNRGSDDDMLYG